MWPPRSRARAAKQISPCSFHPNISKAGRSPPLAMTSRGCRFAMAGCTQLIRRTVISGSYPARAINQIQTPCDRSSVTRFTRTWRLLMTVTSGGREKTATHQRTRLIGAGMTGHRIQKKKLRTQTAGSQLRCATTRRWIRMSRKAKECQSARSFSADAAAIRRRWFIRRSIGLTVSTSAQRWLRKQPPPPPAQWVRSDATRWRCCHSADTTSGIISSTGSILEKG